MHLGLLFPGSALKERADGDTPFETRENYKSPQQDLVFCRHKEPQPERGPGDNGVQQDGKDDEQFTRVCHVGFVLRETHDVDAHAAHEVHGGGKDEDHFGDAGSIFVPPELV